MSDWRLEVTSSTVEPDGTALTFTTSHWITPPEQPWIFDLPRETWQIEDDEDD